MDHHNGVDDAGVWVADSGLNNERSVVIEKTAWSEAEFQKNV